MEAGSVLLFAKNAVPREEWIMVGWKWQWSMFGLLATCTFAVVGCGSRATPSGTSPADAEANAEASYTKEMKDAFRQLSPEDARSAKEQLICPVSGEGLGMMGVPVKVSIEGKAVWVCCDACREKLVGNPQLLDRTTFQ